MLVGGEEVAPGEVALTFETGGGAAESAPDALPYGDYLVREAEAPEGYLGTDAEAPFSIEKDGEMVELTGEGELPGATLRAYDADGELVEEWVSGEEPHELTLLPGTYTLHEELAPEGYLVASDVRFEVVEGVPVTRVEMVDDCTRVDAEKVDAATGEPLAGATMQVVDVEGEVIEEWVSDGEPHRIEALVPGEYVLRETEAPEGYELAEDAPFTVEETADVQVVTMADEALPGTASGTTPGGLPQTGDWSWLVPAACAAGTAACVGGAIALGSRRRAKAGPTAREPM